MKFKRLKDKKIFDDKELLEILKEKGVFDNSHSNSYIKGFFGQWDKGQTMNFSEFGDDKEMFAFTRIASSKIKYIKFPEKFWVVTNPTNVSVRNDILFEADLESFLIQIKGGLTLGEIYGIYGDKKEAEKDAENLLKNKFARMTENVIASLRKN